VEDDLVYVPRVGFRSAHALGTGEKHVVERDGKTLTTEIAPIRDGSRLSVTIAGIDVPPPTNTDYFERGLFTAYPEFGTVGIRDDKGRDIGTPMPGWRGGGAAIRRTTDGEVTLHYNMVIAPLAGGGTSIPAIVTLSRQPSRVGASSAVNVFPSRSTTCFWPVPSACADRNPTRGT